MAIKRYGVPGLSEINSSLYIIVVIPVTSRVLKILAKSMVPLILPLWNAVPTTNSGAIFT